MDAYDFLAKRAKELLDQYTINVDWTATVERQRWDVMIIITGISTVNGKEIKAATNVHHEIDKHVLAKIRNDEPLGWTDVNTLVEIPLRRMKEAAFGAISYVDREALQHVFETIALKTNDLIDPDIDNHS